MNQEATIEHLTNDEKKRFLILINHWIKHNHEHINEYVKLAESLESRGLSGIAGSIREACVFILKANVSLSGAIKCTDTLPTESDYSPESRQINQVARQRKPGKRP